MAGDRVGVREPISPGAQILPSDPGSRKWKGKAQKEKLEASQEARLIKFSPGAVLGTEPCKEGCRGGIRGPGEKTQTSQTLTPDSENPLKSREQLFDLCCFLLPRLTSSEQDQGLV